MSETKQQLIWQSGDHALPGALRCLLPELVALACWGLSPEAWLYLLLPMVIRAVMVVSVALHGIGHALGAGSSSGARLRHYLKRFQWEALLPFGEPLLPGLMSRDRLPEMPVNDLTPGYKRLAAIMGPVANLLLVSLLVVAYESTSGASSLLADLLILSILVNLWILLSSLSDYQTFLAGKGSQLFCGNFGILAKRQEGDIGFLPSRFRLLTKVLGTATDIRGQQAGGIAVLAQGGHFVGCKVVNDKRGGLTETLLRAFRASAASSRLRCIRPLEKTLHLIAHYRYGTSSGPSERETHWHRWMKPHQAMVWEVQGSQLVEQKRRISHLITHNGDFLAWSAPNGRLEHEELGRWLGDVLGTRNPATGDSPKIAGMMDLLCTQGQWESSVRLAFAFLTGEAMGQDKLVAIGRAFDRVFREWIVSVTEPDSRPCPFDMRDCASLTDVINRNPDAVRLLSKSLWQACLPLTRDWPDTLKQRRQRIVGQTIQAFFYNDLNEATRAFMYRAEGTFGLVTTSSLEPGVVCLVAYRQPLFIATDPKQGLIAYASEAAALRSTSKLQGRGLSLTLPYRFDLFDGDIALIKVNDTDTPNRIKLSNLYSSRPTQTIDLTEAYLEQASYDSSRWGWVAQYNNPYINERFKHGDDLVLDEMSAIPSVLKKIENSWADHQSLNRRTAQAFSDDFLKGAAEWGHEQSGTLARSINPELDLMVLGIEGGLHMAATFCEDLRRVFPYLHTEAVDAVSYCENPHHFAVGARTITLAISHSGQTFNTVDAVKFIYKLYQRRKAGPVYVMTGEVDTVLAAIVGQSVHVGVPWSERIFVTEAGWRTAEPATVSSVAIHATLTRLLLHLVREARTDTRGRTSPYGVCVNEKTNSFLEQLAGQSAERCSSLLGHTSEGWDLKTDDHRALCGEGEYLSKIIIEPAVAFMIAAVHLFMMLWLGWNPVEGIQSLVFAYTALPIFDQRSPVGEFALVMLETGYFLFASAAFILVIRWWQNRPLWDRAFSGRSLIIGDLPYVNKLLAQYVSKLFSQSYEFTGFAAIYAADPRSSDLLHSYGHRITRGTLLFIGFPDGRWPGQTRMEAAVGMTCSQARSVKNVKAGATVVGIGHNPESARMVDRYLRVSMPLGANSLVTGRCCLELASDLQESRFASLERLIGAYVVFHTAAVRASRFTNRLIPLANLFWMPVVSLVWIFTLGRVKAKLGCWDLSRTQSGTLIATTASPAPAITLSPDDYRPLAERIGITAGLCEEASVKPICKIAGSSALVEIIQ